MLGYGFEDQNRDTVVSTSTASAVVSSGVPV